MRFREIKTFVDLQIALESWNKVELYMPNSAGEYVGEVIGTCYHIGEPAANVRKVDGTTSVFNFNGSNSLNPDTRTFYEVF